MDERCSECGAPVPSGGSCGDHFNALLLLEWEIPGGAGEIHHYYAVTSYILQHPISMNYRVDVLASARSTMANLLDGKTSLDRVRKTVRQAADGPARIVRRSGDEVPPVLVRDWPITAADVVSAGADRYGERVVAWARSVLATISEHT